ncbi:MAG: VWA domain-containing protein, partial [Nitratireductor sp.]
MKTLKLLAAAAVCALAATSAGAAERAVIVLDASGSMWGQIDGKPKLEIARETLSDVLTTLPVELELGLMAYGHREKGNCKDIELIVEPAAGAAPRIAEAAGGLRFLGKTPLSAAVERAAEALRYTEDKATVVLITDGIETCNADPCALATSLEQSGVDFTAHVVGFGLSREEGRQVACLAENTGGKYIRAGDAAELKEALT